MRGRVKAPIGPPSWDIRLADGVDGVFALFVWLLSEPLIDEVLLPDSCGSRIP